MSDSTFHLSRELSLAFFVSQDFGPHSTKLRFVRGEAFSHDKTLICGFNLAGNLSRHQKWSRRCLWLMNRFLFVAKSHHVWFIFALRRDWSDRSLAPSKMVGNQKKLENRLKIVRSFPSQDDHWKAQWRHTQRFVRCSLLFSFRNRCDRRTKTSEKLLTILKRFANTTRKLLRKKKIKETLPPTKENEVEWLVWALNASVVVVWLSRECAKCNYSFDLCWLFCIFRSISFWVVKFGVFFIKSLESSKRLSGALKFWWVSCSQRGLCVNKVELCSLALDNRFSVSFWSSSDDQSLSGRLGLREKHSRFLNTRFAVIIAHKIDLTRSKRWENCGTISESCERCAIAFW